MNCSGLRREKQKTRKGKIKPTSEVKIDRNSADIR